MHRGIYYAKDGGLGVVGGPYTPPGYFEAIGCSWTGERPVFVPYRGDMYVVGYFTRPVVEHRRTGQWSEAGIRPPMKKISVGQGNSTGGSEGLAMCYITGLHKIGAVVVAESNPSNVVNVGELAGKGRAWSNIQAKGWDPRVTHVRGYCSMDGATYRQAWERPIGITSISENVKTARLSNQGPAWTHGIPPATRLAHAWVGRMFYANSAAYPHRVWFSEAGYPQSVRAASFLDTPDREPVTALWKGRNELLVFARRGNYMVREAATGIFVIERLDSTIGCINHHGIHEINNVVWFPSEDTVYWYNGSFIDAMPDMRKLWADDVKANGTAFRNGYAMIDLQQRAYIFVTNRTAAAFENTSLSPKTIAYVACWASRDNQDPSQGQATPDWMLDFRGRADTAGCLASDGTLLVGSEDGIIRAQDAGNADDDGDTLQKPFYLEHGHRLLAVGRDDESGAQLNQFWAHMESEYNGWRLELVGGDEWACLQKRPNNGEIFWGTDVPSSMAGNAVGGKSWFYVPKTVHFFVPERVSGRGFLARVSATKAKGIRYRGHGGTWSPGQAPRGPLGELDQGTIAGISVTNWFYYGGAWYHFGVDELPTLYAGQTLKIGPTIYDDPEALTFPVIVTYTITGDTVYNGADRVDQGASPLDTESDPVALVAGSSFVTVSARDAAGHYGSASFSIFVLPAGP